MQGPRVFMLLHQRVRPGKDHLTQCAMFLVSICQHLSAYVSMCQNMPTMYHTTPDFDERQCKMTTAKT